MPEKNTLSSSESLRQAIHIGVVLLAFLLRFLPTPWAFFLLFVLVVHNVVLLPRYAPGLFRAGERGLGGIVLYPLGIAVLILCFPDRMEIVAGVWALLAVGDGLATLVGQLYPLRRLPWNPDKSLGGLLSFVVGGALACSLLVVWTDPVMGNSAWILLICAVCALVGGLAETLLLPVGDNILIPLMAAPSLSVLLTVQISAGYWTLTLPALICAILLNGIVATAARFFRLVSTNGAVGAAVVGVFVYILGGPAAYALLLLLFIFEPVIMRLKIIQRITKSATEETSAQDGSAYTIANFGFAFLLILVWVFTDGVDPLLQLMYVAALATAFSGIVVRKFGAILDHTPLNGSGPELSGMEGVLSTSGGILGLLITRIAYGPTGEKEGTLSTGEGILGVASAVIFTGCAGLVGFCDASLAPAAIIGATLGAWSKPIMYATARKRNLALDIEAMSFVATCVGALSAGVFAYLLGGAWYS